MRATPPAADSFERGPSEHDRARIDESMTRYTVSARKKGEGLWAPPPRCASIDAAAHKKREVFTVTAPLGNCT